MLYSPGINKLDCLLGANDSGRGNDKEVDFFPVIHYIPDLIILASLYCPPFFVIV